MAVSTKEACRQPTFDPRQAGPIIEYGSRPMRPHGDARRWFRVARRFARSALSGRLPDPYPIITKEEAPVLPVLIVPGEERLDNAGIHIKRLGAIGDE